MGHLAKMNDEFGKKGFQIIAITNEDGKGIPESKKQVLQYMTHVDGQFNYRVAVGGGGAYNVRGVPHGVLIGPDGIIKWRGNPGSIDKDLLKDLLKEVVEPTPEVLEARAGKVMTWADKFVEDKLYYRAAYEFERIAEEYASTAVGKRAAERAKEMSDGDFKAEYDAQASVHKIVGGIERPKEKLKSKKAEGNAKKLLKLAEKMEETPRAKQLAEEWADIFANKWK